MCEYCCLGVHSFQSALTKSIPYEISSSRCDMYAFHIVIVKSASEYYKSTKQCELLHGIPFGTHEHPHPFFFAGVPSTFFFGTFFEAAFLLEPTGGCFD